MKFQPPKGTRDLVSEDANRLEEIIEICRDVFQKYGFEPLITPAFESFELLAAKGGLGEAVKDEIYYFKDKSDRELGLRFDFTMPLARFVSSNPQLPKPFKRYAIDKVWRYDNPQSMRWREFWQADIDIVGSDSLLADVECLAAICEVLDRLGFKKYQIRANNRKLLQNIFRKFVDESKVPEIFRIMDKFDKIGIEGIKEQIKIVKITELLLIKGDNEDVLKQVKYKYGNNEGIEELGNFLAYAKKFGIDSKIEVDLSLARGLDYYTGMIFEVDLGSNLSCGGGGRYDNLIGMIGKENIPATGISLGLDRILEVMKQNKMFKEEKNKTSVFVANVDESVVSDVINVVQKLRENRISAQMDLVGKNLSKQLEYANSLGIPYVIVIGKKEVESKKFKLKDMKRKTEKDLSLESIIKELRKSLI